MKIYHSYLTADPKTQNSASLDTLRCATTLRKKLCDYQERLLVILDQWSWIVTQKAGPYCDKDCMIIYWWENREVRALTDCTHEERVSLQKLLKYLVSSLEKEYYAEILHHQLQLIIGINTASEPWAGKSQSVFRPHIHICLFPLKEILASDNRGFTLREETLDTNLQKLNINRENKYLLEQFEDFITRKFPRFAQKFTPAIVYDNQYHALDIALFDDTSIIWWKNTQTMMFIYSLLESFSQSFYKKLEKNFCVEYNSEKIEFRKWDLAYSLACYREWGKTVLRVKFTYRNEWERWASMEIAWFPISRGVGPTLPLAWSKEFKNRLLQILGNIEGNKEKVLK